MGSPPTLRAQAVRLALILAGDLQARAPPQPSLHPLSIQGTLAVQEVPKLKVMLRALKADLLVTLQLVVLVVLSMVRRSGLGQT